jgi:hypothetical protein
MLEIASTSQLCCIRLAITILSQFCHCFGAKRQKQSLIIRIPYYPDVTVTKVVGFEAEK